MRQVQHLQRQLLERPRRNRADVIVRHIQALERRESRKFAQNLRDIAVRNGQRVQPLPDPVGEIQPIERSVPDVNVRPRRCVHSVLAGHASDCLVQVGHIAANQRIAVDRVRHALFARLGFVERMAQVRLGEEASAVQVRLRGRVGGVRRGRGRRCGRGRY